MVCVASEPVKIEPSRREMRGSASRLQLWAGRAGLHNISACGLSPIRLRSRSSGKRHGWAMHRPARAARRAPRKEMDSLLKFMIIALILIVGVAFVAVCDDAFCVSCGHVWSGGADRSCPLSRFARKICAVLAAAFSSALAWCAMTYRRSSTIPASFVCIPALERVSSLRI